MKTIMLAIVLTAVGLVACLWLLAGVTWYNFMVFMLVAQPLLLLGAVIFAVVAIRDRRRKGLL